MKRLFDEKGHLTQEAFEMLANKELDDLQRLKIAEHNSLCDKCLDRYIVYIESYEILTPPKIKNKNLYLNQYISLAISACFAMLFWLTGAFSISCDYSLVKLTNNFTQKTVKITQDISNKFNQVFDNIILEGDNLYEKK